MAKNPYQDAEYRWAKERLAAQWTPCSWCGERRAVTPDHDPPLDHFPPGFWRGVLVPSCVKCNARRGQLMTTAKRFGKRMPVSYPVSDW